MIDLKAQKPAKRYAEAIFQIIKDKNSKEILSQIRGILSQVEENPEFKNFMFHPIVSLEDKKQAVKEIFKNYDCDIINFIFLLLDENRLDCLDEIEGVLIEKINEKDKIKMVNVTLAIDIDDEFKDLIQKRIENKLQSRADIKFIKDENILGGMIIRVKDTLVDLSVRNKIEIIKKI